MMENFIFSENYRLEMLWENISDIRRLIDKASSAKKHSDSKETDK